MVDMPSKKRRMNAARGSRLSLVTSATSTGTAVTGPIRSSSARSASRGSLGGALDLAGIGPGDDELGLGCAGPGGRVDGAGRVITSGGFFDGPADRAIGGGGLVITSGGGGRDGKRAGAGGAWEITGGGLIGEGMGAGIDGGLDAGIGAGIAEGVRCGGRLAIGDGATSGGIDIGIARGDMLSAGGIADTSASVGTVRSASRISPMPPSDARARSRASCAVVSTGAVAFAS